LHNLLLECRYKEFWAALYQDDTCASVVHSITGFTGGVRHVIADAIDMSFQAIKTDAVQAYLDIRDQSELDSIMVDRSWTFEGDSIKIPMNAANEAKSVTITENLRFDQVSKVLAYGV
jgi:translation initiation factor 3 subunit K